MTCTNCNQKDPGSVIKAIRKDGSWLCADCNKELTQAPEKSNRYNQWLVFACLVGIHIENYTVPQYGDAPNDQVEQWTAEECIKAINKYCSRFGKNVRAGNSELDVLKIAHFACLAYDKMKG